MQNHETIRQRAHEIWEEAGRPTGLHREHWEQACKEIEGESSMASREPHALSTSAHESDEVGVTSAADATPYQAAVIGTQRANGGEKG